jgi:hypothetical protein
MNIQKLVKTKTFWSGLFLIAYGIASQDPNSILSGLSFIFLRDAVNKVNNNQG